MLKDFMKLFEMKLALKLVILGIIVGLCASLISQFSFGYTPCKLCLIQRVTLAISLIFFGGGYFFLARENHIWKTFIAIAVLLCFSTFACAMYQLLIQFGYLPEPDFCSVNVSILSKDIKEYEQFLEESEYITGCKALGPTMFGLPISFYAGFGSLGMIIYTIICLKIAYSKSKK